MKTIVFCYRGFEIEEVFNDEKHVFAVSEGNSITGMSIEDFDSMESAIIDIDERINCLHKNCKEHKMKRIIKIKGCGVNK